MRISVEKRDPGYREDAARTFEVLLDGKALEGCVTADEEKGVAEVLLVGADGRLQETPNRKAIDTRWVRGKVEIRRRG